MTKLIKFRANVIFKNTISFLTLNLNDDYLIEITSKKKKNYIYNICI